MAEDDRTFRTSTPAANRAEMQGLGVGQKELNAQQAPNRDQHATDPQRLEPFENDPAGPGDDRGQASGDLGGATARDDGQAADLDAAALGVGVPSNVDVHDLGEKDNPLADFGDETDPGLIHSANHTRRPIKTEAERGQGAKTRRANKDIVSRRS